MTTTSLKLPGELKQRAVEAARKQGISPHAFMVHAIEEAASAAEQHASFVADAHAARQHALTTGQGHDAQEVHAYLKQRIIDRTTPKPKARSWQN